MDVKAHGPSSAVDEFGNFRFGCFRSPIYKPDFGPANLSDCNGFWGRGNRRGLGAWLRKMRLKEWHFFAIFSEDYVLAAAIAHLGYVSNVFCRLVERDTHKVHVYERIIPFARNVVFAESSVRGATRYREGTDFMVFEYQTSGGGLWSCSFNLAFDPKNRLKGQISIIPEESVALLYPLGANRGAYTHKEAGNEVEGLVTFGMQELRLDEFCYSTMDWTRSFADRHTRWNWLTAAGASGDGRRVGINLSEHIYQAAENFIWVDGKPQPVGGVEFTAPKAKGDPWRIKGDRVDLALEPEGEWRQDVNMKLLKSRFVQNHGLLEGSIRFDSGRLQVSGLYGIAEQHDAIW